MRATIISIAPCQIIQSNPSLVPPDILIAACVDENKPVLHRVDDISTIEYIPLKEKGKGGRLNPVSGLDYAKALVNDFLTSVIYSNPGESATPGVIAVEGQVLVDKIPLDVMNSLKERQARWQDIVIKKTDDMWNKFGQHKFIMEIAITIAKKLNLEREWAKKSSESFMKVCPACMIPIHPLASICSNCRTIIDPDRYKKFELATS